MADELTQRVIQIILRAKNEMNADIDAAAGKMQGFGETATQMGKRLETIGGSMMLAGAGVAAGIGVLVSKAAEFETTTTALVTGAGEQASALGGVRQALLDLAPEVGVGPTELAKGLYMINSAGYYGAAGEEVLKASAQGAKIGMADQAVVADALTTVLKDYHLSASDAAGVTGQMTAAVASGKMHWEDFAASLSKVLPIAAGLNIPFQEVAAAEAVMTAHGVDAARAATAIQAGLMQLIAPSDKAKTAIADLGINYQELQTKLASGNFQGVMQMFSDAMASQLPASAKGAMAAAQKALADGVDPEQVFSALEVKLGPRYAKVMSNVIEAFGGVRGGALALNLLPNMGEFATDITNIGTVQEGAAKHAAAWAEVQKDLAFQIDRLKAQVASTVITLGNAFFPAVQQLVAFLLPLVKHIGEWALAHQNLVAHIGVGVVAVLLIGGAIIMLVGFILTLIGALHTLIIGAIVPVIGAFVSLVVAMAPVLVPLLMIIGVVAMLREAWVNNLGGMRDVTTSVVNWIGGALDKVFDILNKARTALGMAPIDWREQWQALTGAVTGAGDTVGDAASSAAGSIKDGFARRFAQIKDDLMSPLVDMKASGIDTMSGMKDGMLEQADQLQAGLKEKATAQLPPELQVSPEDQAAFQAALNGTEGGMSKSDLAFQHQVSTADLAAQQREADWALTDEHNAAMAQLEDQHTQKMQMLAEQHAKIMSGLKRAHQSTVDETASYDAMKTDETNNYRAAKETEMANYTAQQRANMRADSAEKLDLMTSYHQQKTGEIAAATQTAAQNVNTAMASGMGQAATTHAQFTQTIADDHATQMKRMVDSTVSAVRQMDDALKGPMAGPEIAAAGGKGPAGVQPWAIPGYNAPSLGSGTGTDATIAAAERAMAALEKAGTFSRGASMLGIGPSQAAAGAYDATANMVTAAATNAAVARTMSVLQDLGLKRVPDARQTPEGTLSVLRDMGLAKNVPGVTQPPLPAGLAAGAPGTPTGTAASPLAVRVVNPAGEGEGSITPVGNRAAAQAGPTTISVTVADGAVRVQSADPTGLAQRVGAAVAKALAALEVAERQQALPAGQFLPGNP